MATAFHVNCGRKCLLKLESRVLRLSAARRLDPARPVTLVGVQGGPVDWRGIFDAVCTSGVQIGHGASGKSRR